MKQKTKTPDNSQEQNNTSEPDTPTEKSISDEETVKKIEIKKKPSKAELEKKIDPAVLKDKVMNSILPVRFNPRVYMNQTALIYQLAKSKLVINIKTKNPIISTNKRVKNSNKNSLNNRHVAKLTVTHVMNKQ
jgi:hypothetical protein